MSSRKPTSHDVARTAGVSQTTVSYVMSGRRAVAPETERRVLEAMQQLGYQPHSGARALRSSRSNVLGVVLPYHAGADPSSQHHLLISLATQARKYNYDILLVTAEEGESELRRVIDTALCDGLFILEVLLDDPRAEIIATSGTPAVFIGIPGTPDPIIAIDADYRYAAEQSVEKLKNAGHRRIHLLTPGDPSLTNLNFIDRFDLAVQQQTQCDGIELVVHQVFASYERIVDYLSQMDIRSGDGILLAPVVSADDWCNALRTAGWNLGTDLSLIATHWDAARSHTLDHPTRFNMRNDYLSEQAVELLLARISSNPPTTRELHFVQPEFAPGNTVIVSRAKETAVSIERMPVLED